MNHHWLKFILCKRECWCVVMWLDTRDWLLTRHLELGAAL